MQLPVLIAQCSKVEVLSAGEPNAQSTQAFPLLVDDALLGHRNKRLLSGSNKRNTVPAW